MATPAATVDADALPAEDSDFSLEFGCGELARRLWRGGLRLDGSRNHILGDVSSHTVITNALADRLDQRAADSLCADIRATWVDDSKMERACKPLRRLGIRSGESSHAGMQSLVRAVLAVDRVQPELLTFLVQRIAELADEQCYMARALLYQLKWLDYIVDGTALCETLLAIVDVIPPALKRDIVESLPEIIDDVSRPTAIEALVELLDANHSMMAPIVDALGALGVDDARLEAVNGSVLAALAAADREMLPVSIRYLIKTSPPSMHWNVVTALRQNLAMPSLGSNAGRLCIDATRAGFRMQKSVADQALKAVRSISSDREHRPADVWIILALLDSPVHRKLAETLFRHKTAVGMFSQGLIDAAIAPFVDGLVDQSSRIITLASISIKANEAASRRVGVSLFAMIFRLFAQSTTRREVVACLLDNIGSRRALEVDAGLDALTAIAREGEDSKTLLPYFATLQGLLDFLETFSDSQLRKIWTLLGLVCRSSMRSRRNSYVTKISDGIERFSNEKEMFSKSGSQPPGERPARGNLDNGDIVCNGNRDADDDDDDDDDGDDDDDDDDEGEFPNESVCEIDNFRESIPETGVDGSKKESIQRGFRNSKSTGHRRLQGRHVSGFARSVSSNTELQPLLIVLRKELTHTEAIYRRIGTLGTCTLVSVLGTAATQDILRILIGPGPTRASSEALAFDELAFVLSADQGASKETLQVLYKRISLSFETRFIANLDEAGDKVEHCDLRHEPWFNLDGPRADLCVPISRYLSGQQSQSRDILQVIAPQLRLVYTLASLCHDGSLDEIDAVIGCPLRLPLRSIVDNFGSLPTSSQRIVLVALLSGYSWMVEIVNGFSLQTNCELRAKCLRRMDHILELRDLISNCVSETTAWREALTEASGSWARSGGALGCVSSSKNGLESSRSVAGGIGREDICGKVYPDQWTTYTRTLTPAALSLISITSPVSWKSSESFTAIPGDSEVELEAVELSTSALKHLLTELVHHVDAGLAMSNNPKGRHALSQTLLGTLTSKRTTGAQQAALTGLIQTSPLAHFHMLRAPLLAIGPQLGRCIQKMIGAEELGDVETYCAYQQCVILCLTCFAGSITSDVLMIDPAARELLFDILAAIRFTDTEAAVIASDPLSDLDIQLAGKSAFLRLWSKLDVLSKDGVDDIEESDVDNISVQRGSLLSFENCTALLAALDATFMFCSDKDKDNLGRRLSDAAGSVLERQWDSDTLKSRKTLCILPGLIRLYVRWAGDPMDTITLLREQLASFSVAETRKAVIEASTRADESQHGIGNGTALENTTVHWGSLSPRTCQAFYIGLLEQLQWAQKCFRPNELESSALAFSRMEGIVLEMQAALMLVRSTERFIGPALRAGRNFVDMFLRTSLPFLKDEFRQEPKSVVKILKSQQKATRLLQSFCAHGKSLRDTTLASLVPPLRKSLELLLYKVKELLQSQNKQRAFTVSDLKNRNIRGDVVQAEDQYFEQDVSDDDAEERDIDGMQANNMLYQNENDVSLGSAHANHGSNDVGVIGTKTGAPTSRKRRSNLIDLSIRFKGPGGEPRETSQRRGIGKKTAKTSLCNLVSRSPDEYSDGALEDDRQKLDSCSDEEELIESNKKRRLQSRRHTHQNEQAIEQSGRSKTALTKQRHAGKERKLRRNQFIDDEAHDDSDGVDYGSNVDDSLSGFLVRSDDDDTNE
jgi:hypothetical protein